MADDMDVDEVPKAKERKEKDSGKARFEVKKVKRAWIVGTPGILHYSELYLWNI